MRLTKITELGAKGNFEIGQRELLICQWNNDANPDFYSIDTSKAIKQVDQQYFAMATIGEIYTAIEKVLPYPIHDYRMAKSKNGNFYFCTFSEGYLYGFDKSGNNILKWMIDVGQGHPIYDLEFQEPDFIWLAFPTGQTVSQVSLINLSEIFRIGDYSWEWENKIEQLSYPENISISGNELFIPNMGNKKLFKVDLSTKRIELQQIFEERIWQYEETEFGIFLITDSGLYELEKSH